MNTEEKVGVQGFFRLQITEEGKVMGDTGWVKNTITDAGKNEYLALTLGKLAGSKQVGFAALGEGTLVDATATSLDLEITDSADMRMVVSPATIDASGHMEFSFVLSSGIATAPHTISNIGLFDASVPGAGQIFSGNTFTSSTLAVNQAVNGVYRVNF